MGRGVVVALVGILVAANGCERLESALYRRAAEQVASGPDRALVDADALQVVLCGTGSPMPDPTRAGACTAILADGRLVVVDVGPGSWENVALWRLPTDRLAAVFLTHFHSDHIGDLYEAVLQSWAWGRHEPLRVYGPPGVGEVVAGFRRAYAADARYRVAHHGPAVMPPAGGELQAVEMATGDDGAVTLGALRVTAFPVDHAPVSPAVGYRFDYGGRAVVVSGDTARSASVEAAARGADVLVHEVIAAHMTDRMATELRAVGRPRLGAVMADIASYHTTPTDAVAVAEAAGVRMLVLSHVVPPLRNWIVRRLFMAGVPNARMPVLVGEDGLWLSLPLGSKTIDRGALSE